MKLGKENSLKSWISEEEEEFGEEGGESEGEDWFRSMSEDFGGSGE